MADKRIEKTVKTKWLDGQCRTAQIQNAVGRGAREGRIEGDPQETELMQGRLRARLSLAASWVRTPREAAWSRRIPVTEWEITYMWCFGGLAQARGGWCGSSEDRRRISRMSALHKRWRLDQDRQASDMSSEMDSVDEWMKRNTERGRPAVNWTRRVA